MNKFLKLAVVPIAFLIAGNTTSCTVSPKEIALITDVGDINDGSFNQESWEAVKEYATDNHKSYDFYRPFNDSSFAQSCSIKQAIAKGAKMIVLPGFKFAGTCATESRKYPDVHFLLIDSTTVPNEEVVSADNLPENVCCVGFKCGYSGFAAGYATATDLLTRDWDENQKLLDTYGYGYCGGMPTPGVFEFGFGFIQGICRATADFCQSKNIPLEKEKVPQLNINYYYANTFAQDDNAAAAMKGWLASDKDIKVIFPCGGKLYQSAEEAVQYYNSHQTSFNYNDWLSSTSGSAPRQAARWIGVDSDQYRGLKYEYEKKTIYTSALKGLKKAIQHTLNLHFEDRWQCIGGYHKPGPVEPQRGEFAENGQWILGLNSILGEYPIGIKIEADTFVGIPEESNETTGVLRGFEKYTINNYKELINKLSDKDNPIPVYDRNGTEFGAEQGDPTDMVDWDNGHFRETYLGNYPKEKIYIDVI
ncbi:MAG: BMP family ABC transporter substrate-binding protein [Bacilli bacterium]|nr:BMP family ABC transporter substrate-binding protein [Bacilli bacterium]